MVYTGLCILTTRLLPMKTTKSPADKASTTAKTEPVVSTPTSKPAAKKPAASKTAAKKPEVAADTNAVSAAPAPAVATPKPTPATAAKKSEPAKAKPGTAKAPELGMSERVGLTAGSVWHYLSENGPTSIAKLLAALDEEEKIIQRSIGWLAQEDKVAIVTENRIETISLK